MNPVRVFACEAQPIVLEGLARVLEQDGEFEYAGAAASLAEALDALREREPDVLLVDQSAGLKQIFQFVSDAKSTRPRCYPILWISELAEIDCFRALQLGARGVVLKDSATQLLLKAIQTVMAGEYWVGRESVV